MDRQVLLSGDFVSLVDDEDYPLVTGYRWHAQRDGRTWYARAVVYLGREGGRQRCRHLVMHRLILGCPKGQRVDHIDGNGLNNRRGNLRLATNAQNGRNARLPINNTTGFKGVTFARRVGRFQASLECDGKSIWCGYHDTAVAAARAYNAAAIEHFGEFARINDLTEFCREHAAKEE